MKYLLIVVFIFFGSYIAIGQNRKEAKIIDAYLNVSNQRIGDKYMPVIKWNKDSIAYYMYGNMKGMTKKKWNRFLSKVEKSSGLHFYKVLSNEDAQILIYFGKIKDYFEYEGIDYKFKMNPDWLSWSNRVYDFSFGLKKTSFCIDKDEIHDFNHMRYLIKNNFLNALGLFGQLEKRTCILSEKYSCKNKNRNLRKLDKACIAIHYSDLVKSGMKREEVERNLKSSKELSYIIEKAN